MDSTVRVAELWLSGLRLELPAYNLYESDRFISELVYVVLTTLAVSVPSVTVLSTTISSTLIYECSVSLSVFLWLDFTVRVAELGLELPAYILSLFAVSVCSVVKVSIITYFLNFKC